jgi:hypothetical protein
MTLSTTRVLGWSGSSQTFARSSRRLTTWFGRRANTCITDISFFDSSTSPSRVFARQLPKSTQKSPKSRRPLPGSSAAPAPAPPVPSPSTSRAQAWR